MSGCINSSYNNQNNTELPVLNDYDQWRVDYFGSIDRRDSGYARDPDHDYVDNQIEYQKGTNPTTPNTFQGLDDFNLLYTYPQYFTNISDKNLTQSQINDFLEKIPNVEPRYWTNVDGSALNTYKDGIYVNVSLRDPLVKYYADKVHIEWEDQEVYDKVGHLKLGEEPLWLEYDRIDNNKTLVTPAYYLTHGRKGTCVEVATAHTAILVSKGYKCSQFTAEIPINDEYIPHGFLETSINGSPYIVNFNLIIPKYAPNGKSFYELSNWDLNKNYDQNWINNKNFNYM